MVQMARVLQATELQGQVNRDGQRSVRLANELGNVPWEVAYDRLTGERRSKAQIDALLRRPVTLDGAVASSAASAS